MTPQSIKEQQESTEAIRLPEEYVRQVEDRSRPATEVLMDEQEARAVHEAPVLFIP